MSSASTVASAVHGTKSELQACLAHPGAEMLRCTSPGRTPFPYMPERWPTGDLTWMCSTIFDWDVVPEVR